MDAADLTALLSEHASRHSVPGAAIGILRDGAVETAVYGRASASTREPVTPETRFSAGSLTKSMVATVIARLAESGRLSLDDPVLEHVPELRGSVWAAGVALRDLLANRSGLPLRTDLEFGFALRTDTDDDALARLVADIPRDVPRSSLWSYSNVGWCVLGRAIETATGAVWEEAMQGLLLDPAGMSETSFAADPAERPRAYGPAGTTVVTTAADLLRFAALHLDDPSLEALREVHSDVSISAWLDSWCLGWARFDWDGGPVWGWDGLIGSERSVLRLVPEQRAAVVLLTSSDMGRAMYRSLFAELFASTFGIVVPPLRLDPLPRAADDLSRFAGTYAWPDRRIQVTATANGLLLSGDEGESEAFPLEDAAFVVDATDADTPTVTFGAFGEDGRPGVLYQMLWGLPRVDR